MNIFNRQSMQTRQSIAVDVQSDLGPGMHPRVSIIGGHFALIDGGGNRYNAPVIFKNTPQGQIIVMRAIIIGSNPKKSRVFYADKFDPDNPGPPNCFSDNGVGPSSNASEPQARTCGECFFQKWGSDYSEMTGKKTKACNEKKKLAILVVGDTAGLAYELQVPPATLKNMTAYSGLVQGFNLPGANRRADLCDVVTEISFVPGQTGVLEFNGHCLLDAVNLDANGALQISYNQMQQPLTAVDGGAGAAQLIDEIWEGNELDDLLGLKDQPFIAPAGFIGPGSQGFAQMPQGAPAAAVTHQPAAAAPTPYSPPPGAPGQQPTTLQTGATASSPQSEQQPAVRARKPRAARAAAQAAPQLAAAPQLMQAPAASAAPSVQQETPGFMQEHQRRQAGSPMTNGAAQSFGTETAPPPGAGMEAALATAFSLPTKR